MPQKNNNISPINATRGQPIKNAAPSYDVFVNYLKYFLSFIKHNVFKNLIFYHLHWKI